MSTREISCDADFRGRALSFSAVAALTLNPALTRWRPATRPSRRPSSRRTKSGTLSCTRHRKSVVIDFPNDVKDVLVGDPKIANAVVRSPQRLHHRSAVGQTNVVFFDAAGSRSPLTTSRSSAISTACAQH